MKKQNFTIFITSRKEKLKDANVFLADYFMTFSGSKLHGVKWLDDM
jgi:hypothetical protein